MPTILHSLLRRLASSPLALFTVALLFMTLHLSDRLYLSELSAWDARFYYQMASTPGRLDAVPAPFGYRWLPHELVAFVPLDPRRAYELLTFVSLVAAALGLQRLLVLKGAAPRVALAVIVLGFLWARWGGRFYVWYRAGTDPFAYALIAWGLVFAEKRQLFRLAAIATVGALCREYTLLLFPYYALRHARECGWAKALWSAGLCAAPCMVMLLLSRWISPVVGDYSEPRTALESLHTKFGSATELGRICASLLTHGGLVSVVLLMLPGSLALLKQQRELAFWIAAALTLGVIGGTDTDRLMFYAVPAELALLAQRVTSAAFVRDQHAWPFLAAASLGQVVISQTFAPTIMPANLFGWSNLASAAAWGAILAMALAKARTQHEGRSHTVRTG